MPKHLTEVRALPDGSGDGRCAVALFFSDGSSSTREQTFPTSQQAQAFADGVLEGVVWGRMEIAQAIREECECMGKDTGGPGQPVTPSCKDVTKMIDGKFLSR
ncbi:MAG: hypothetical protein EPO12_05240 [Aquabacterium sp.]|jgi:hypothetical protein|nr:MAG: hypothetical protein EPO12_05240 [Aquabacterium sp.]